MSSTTTTEKPTAAPALEPLRVNGNGAARIMGVSRSTFFQRVKDRMYPVAGKDGLWSVRLLRECCEKLDETEPQQT